MGGKIELVDVTCYEEEDLSDSQRIVTNNRHSWHANTYVSVCLFVFRFIFVVMYVHLFLFFYARVSLCVCVLCTP